MPVSKNNIGNVFMNVVFFLVLLLFFFSLFLTFGFFVLGEASKYTFSVIGNYFSTFYRSYYRFWSSFTAFSLLLSFIYLNNILNGQRMKTMLLPFVSSVLLPIVALIPAKSAFQPTAHAIHFILSIVHAILILMVIMSFIRKIEISILVQRIGYILVFISFFGSLLILAITGRNGYFQLFYYFSVFILISFLMFYVRKKLQI